MTRAKKGQTLRANSQRPESPSKRAQRQPPARRNFVFLCLGSFNPKESTDLCTPQVGSLWGGGGGGLQAPPEPWEVRGQKGPVVLLPT